MLFLCLLGYISLFAEILARLIDSIAINRTTLDNGNLLKRRKWGRSWIIVFGNLFLKVSNSKILMFSSTSAWQQYETDCYVRLYCGGCDIIDKDTLRIHPFAGQSIRDLIQQNAINTKIMQSIAQELWRVHQLDNWSHGDLHTSNVLWDGDCIRFIDFETYHQFNIATSERYADDLLVFLLDFIGRTSSDEWLSQCQALIETYNNHAVLQHLHIRLKLPRGLELVLWKTRTNYLSNHILADRINTLHQLVGDLLRFKLSHTYRG